MALVALSDDALGVVFEGLRNTLDPRVLLALSSASKGLRALTQALQQQLRADHETAAALCFKVGLRSCKELREAKAVHWDLPVADLVTLGTLGSVLPALKSLILIDRGAASPEGVQRLAERLGAGALPAVTWLQLTNMHVGDAGASALAVALGRGALPRLKSLWLRSATISDAGLVALAPALRQRPSLKVLYLTGNSLGDEGLAALVPPPLPSGALPAPTGGLKKLKELHLRNTHITDASCAALAAALDSGALPALEQLSLIGIPASAEAKATVYAALAKSKAAAFLPGAV